MLDVAAIWQPDTQQRNYRALLRAMSRPGTCHPLVGIDEGRKPAQAVLSTLVDSAISLADPAALLDAADWPLLQARRTEPAVADYVLLPGDVLPDFEPKLGTLPNPEQSATLIVVMDALIGGSLSLTMTGPGIKDRHVLAVSGLAAGWVARRESWNGAFPLGVDLILVDAHAVAAIPRTTRIEVR